MAGRVVVEYQCMCFIAIGLALIFGVYTGARLYLGFGSAVPPDYVMLASSQVRDGDSPDDQGNLDTFDDGLWCQSALNSSNIGSWNYPATPSGYGVVPNSKSSPLPFYEKHSIGQVGLALENSMQAYSGYYRCIIPDESNNTQVLHVVLYPDSVFSGYSKSEVVLVIAIINCNAIVNELFIAVAGPSVDPGMQLSLVSPRHANPPVFTLSFNVSFGPPTMVNCIVDGNDLNITLGDVAREVKRIPYNGTVLPDMTEVRVTIRQRQAGAYNCTVHTGGVENGTSNLIMLGSGSSFAAISG